jgi:hypothetical protein
MKKQLIKFSCILISFGAFAQIPSNIPTDGLVGWWPFNGGANDESGNSNNGNVNGAILTNDRNGNTNSAYLFDIANNVEIPHNNIYNSSEMTISLWFNVSSFDTQVLLSKRESSGWGNSFELNIGQANNMNGIGTTWSVGGNQSLSYLNENILNNQWDNFVFVYKSDSVLLFLNGLYVNGALSNGNLNSNNLPITIGSRGNGLHQTIGKIDDIAIWNRVLTPQEINVLFTACSPDLVQTQPSNQSSVIGSNSIFTTNSSELDATFQWQTDLGLGFQNLTNAGQYSGVTTNELTVSNLTQLNNNQTFRCLVSKDECIGTSDIATLTVGTAFINEENKNLLNISPNPSENFIAIENNVKNEQIEIYDLTGKLLIKTNANKIDVGNLKSGQYLLKIGDNYRKFVKE